MDEMADYPIEHLVQQLRRKGISRSRFIAVLTGLGASATSIATLLSAAEVDAAALPPPRTFAHHAVERQNAQLHQAHVQRQSAATQHGSAAAGTMSASRRQQLQALLDDYADDAVVEDPLFAAPIVGKAAIAQRKLAEMNSMAGATIEVVHRFAHRNQVVAEWIVRGRHEGDFLGFVATGRQIEVHGMTVVTRENGKITKESLFYDVADLHRQLG
jgi:steroid delta-isomerase-like uncharacterized protein